MNLTKHTCKKCQWPHWSYGQSFRQCKRCGSSEIYRVVMVGATADWPRWAKLIRLVRTDADKGVGDTVQRIAAKFGGERFKAFSARIGMPCGCTQRQEEWNRLWPYD